MTMNVASKLALALCLSVTSGEPQTAQINLPSSGELSFRTEEKVSEVTFERHIIDFVTANYTNTEMLIEEAEVRAAEVLEVIEEEEIKITNRWNIELTEEEIDLLAKIVWVEARGESQTGQEAVIEVIFNRIVSDKFPNTLYDVLSQKNPTQFASWRLRDSARPTEKEYNSIYKVLNGETSVVGENTLYFATKKITRNLDVKIGGHYFCY